MVVSGWWLVIGYLTATRQPPPTIHDFYYIQPMFERLKEKWGVTAGGLALILITFAAGGSLCGYLAKKLMTLTRLENGVGWVIVYLILVTALWPLCVLFLSLFTGQFLFFRKYVGKLGSRIFGKNKK